MLEEIFRIRPFKIRNADEYDVTNILNLFVSPIDGLTTPFDYENTIVKGRMGSGKTMYLQANYAYYLSRLVPTLIDGTDELILPVFIKLNDFQHVSSPEEIYRAIILKVIEELTTLYRDLEDSKKLAAIHLGLKKLPQSLRANPLSSVLQDYLKLDSEEYTQQLTEKLGLNGGAKPSFFELSANWEKSQGLVIKKKPNPGIKDVEECYKSLLEGQDGKILLLIDEAGSLDKSFFREREGSTCFFEILMNQFRTSSFIRTKIAVYPNSYSDILTETRYGDVVQLEDSILDTPGYERFYNRTISLINNYLNPESYLTSENQVGDIFSINQDSMYGDAIEQLMYASSGNMRRLIHLLDMTLNIAYMEHNRAQKITKEHALIALEAHAKKNEDLFNEEEMSFLNDIVDACKTRGAYKFQFPNMSPLLFKYTSRSKEYNLINIVQLGSGRRSTVYSFDYPFTVLKGIPTHYHSNSERIYRGRSIDKGMWISRVAKINQEIIDHATLPGKMNGEISYTKDAVGFITSDSGNEYFYNSNDIINTDKGKSLIIGKKVRFYPTKLGDAEQARLIEIL